MVSSFCKHTAPWCSFLLAVLVTSFEKALLVRYTTSPLLRDHQPYLITQADCRLSQTVNTSQIWVMMMCQHPRRVTLDPPTHCTVHFRGIVSLYPTALYLPILKLSEPSLGFLQDWLSSHSRGPCCNASGTVSN